MKPITSSLAGLFEHNINSQSDYSASALMKLLQVIISALSKWAINIKLCCRPIEDFLGCERSLHVLWICVD